jgi:hypothetical protein
MTGEPDWDFVESIVADIKRRLDAMGPVNLDAIEEFEELEERYNFLKGQHDDLVNSKSELLEVIDRINTETQRLFSETFAQVKINFREMFKELFGEKGEADLTLLDEATRSNPASKSPPSHPARNCNPSRCFPVASAHDRRRPAVLDLHDQAQPLLRARRARRPARRVEHQPLRQGARPLHRPLAVHHRHPLQAHHGPRRRDVWRDDGRIRSFQTGRHAPHQTTTRTPASPRPKAPRKKPPSGSMPN